MTEQEEFEFRARREKELAAAATMQPPAAPVAPPEDKLIPSRPGQHVFASQMAPDMSTVGQHIGNVVKSLPGAAVDATKAIGEGALTTGAGLALSSVGGIAGLATPVTNALGFTDADPASVIRGIQKLAYQPRTAGGQAVTQVLGLPGEALNATGEKVAEVTGSPALGAAVNTGGNALLLGLGGKAALEKPVESIIKHTVDETGQHTVTSPNGVTIADEGPHSIRVVRSDTAKGAEGKGEATARMITLAEKAATLGKKFESDISLSPAAARVWETKLPEAGIKTVKNPSTISPETKNLVSSNPKKGVFEVKAEKPESEMTPDEIHTAAVKTLEENNIPVKRGQRSTDFSNRQIASAGRHADTLLGEGKFNAEQKQKFTSAVLDKAGMDAKNASPEAMSELHGKVQAKYQDLTSRVNTNVDKEFVKDWADIADDAEAVLNTDQLAPIKKQLENLQSKSEAGPGGPIISGRTAQAIRTQLGLMKGSRDSAVTHFASRLQDALDDAFERSASPEDAAKMADAREQFHRMKQIEDAVAGSPDGQISPSKLVTVMSRKRNRGESVYGRGDQELIKLAKAAKLVIPEKVGNSGTPTRLADTTKGVLVGTAHISTLGSLAGYAALGRLANEAGVRARTAEGRFAAAKKAESPAAMRAKALRGAAKTEAVISPQERRRQLQAEALRQ